MVKEYKSGMTARGIRDSSRMISVKAVVCLLGAMEESTMVSGKMESSMAKASSLK